MAGYPTALQWQQLANQQTDLALAPVQNAIAQRAQYDQQQAVLQQQAQAQAALQQQAYDNRQKQAEWMQNQALRQEAYKYARVLEAMGKDPETADGMDIAEARRQAYRVSMGTLQAGIDQAFEFNEEAMWGRALAAAGEIGDTKALNRVYRKVANLLEQEEYADQPLAVAIGHLLTQGDDQGTLNDDEKLALGQINTVFEQLVTERYEQATERTQQLSAKMFDLAIEAPEIFGDWGGPEVPANSTLARNGQTYGLKTPGVALSESGEVIVDPSVKRNDAGAALADGNEGKAEKGGVSGALDRVGSYLDEGSGYDVPTFGDEPPPENALSLPGAWWAFKNRAFPVTQRMGQNADNALGVWYGGMKGLFTGKDEGLIRPSDMAISALSGIQNIPGPTETQTRDTYANDRVSGFDKVADWFNLGQKRQAESAALQRQINQEKNRALRANQGRDEFNRMVIPGPGSDFSDVIREGMNPLQFGQYPNP